MTTPIIMLVIMTAPYLLSRLFKFSLSSFFNPRAAGAIGLGLLFIFTGMGHFAQTAAMVLMLPPWVPEREFLVYASGLLEFAIALGFFIPKYSRIAGLAAAAVLVLFFPLNVYAALNHIPMGGHAWGPAYLLIRAPLQLAILLWVYHHTIKHGNVQLSSEHAAYRPRNT